MSAALIAAIVFTVILLVISGYFLLGSVPLLVLRHDTPLDARFVRAFFDTYYRAATIAAGATAVSYAFAGRAILACGAAGLAVLAVVLRRTVIAKMDALGTKIQASGPDAIASFRRIHVTAILLNLAQLVLVVWSLISLSMELR
jgi:hypothetical protein